MSNSGTGDPETQSIPDLAPSDSISDADRAVNAGLLAKLHPQLLQEMKASMTERSFAAGDFLVRQEETDDSLLLIVEGTARVQVQDCNRRHDLETIGPGTFVGEMALLTREPRTASVLCLAPVEALEMSAEAFHSFARKHPQASVILSRLVAQRLGQHDHDALSGKVFHGYRIQRRLGSGGMALVYRAEDVNTARSVALKMMSHRLVYDTWASEQFQREADIIESLDHENIARMLGRFAAFHSQFIVMELCSGRSLAQALKERGPLPERDARKILGQLVKAVAHAHKAGVLHRDIKPSNVMLIEGGLAKLMDFGLAEPIETEDISISRLIGTPQYMAPELLDGLPVGRASDWFAVGCVAYEMLAGRRLFPEKRLLSLLRLHSEWDLPDFGSMVPEVSKDMQQLLEGATQKSPGARHIDLDTVSGWAERLDWD